MDSHGEIILYQTEDGLTKIDVRFEDETVWLTQQQMADLFQSSRSNIVEHIQHIYEEGELDEISTCRKFRQVRTEGHRQVTREISFFKIVQNKLHYAAHGHTAAEVIFERADAEQEFMGLRSFAGAYLQSLKNAEKEVKKETRKGKKNA